MRQVTRIASALSALALALPLCGFAGDGLASQTQADPAAAAAAEEDPVEEAQGEVWQLPDAAPYQLQFHRTPRATRAALTVLRARGTIDPVSLDEVVASGDGILRGDESPECATAKAAIAELSAHQEVGGYCWEPGAQDGPWYPQGNTTSPDGTGDPGTGDTAGPTGVVSWYSRGSDGSDGVRLSFIDTSDPTAPSLTYANVLLAVPSGTPGDFAVDDLHLHAGGIGWYGHYLYVADTSHGIRLYDLNGIYAVSTGKDSLGVDPGDGKFYAHGYRYVMFEAGRYDRVPQGDGDSLTCDRTPSDIRQNYCFSAMSVDRTTHPASLLTAEYRVHGDTHTDYENGQPTRLLRWPLDASTGLLRTGPHGVVQADAAYGTWTERMQGAMSADGTFYLSTSYGSDPGTLYTDRVGTEGSESRANLTAVGPEAVAYSRPDDRVWSLSEHVGARMVFWMHGADLAP